MSSYDETFAVFTTSESSAYDDQPELRYHFPATYLNQATRAVGGWVLYYEPRRTSGPSSSSGRQAYFAMARLERIEPDPGLDDHYYAYVNGFIEFDRAVPFREGGRTYESGLTKEDGSTNKGAFGRAVRNLSLDEFEAIVAAGFTRPLAEWEPRDTGVAEPIAEYVTRPLVTQIVTRKFRDEAFRRHVRAAYANTCAMTGLRLINGGGRPEVQAAHIRPVEADGPDTVRNGVALTGTMHWLFDRGLVGIDPSYRVMVSGHGLPDDLMRLLRPDRSLLLPPSHELRPHPTFLNWHRTNRFKP